MKNIKNKYLLSLFFIILNIPNCIIAQQQYSKTMYNYKGSGGDTGINFLYDIILTYDRNITGQLTSVIVNGANKGVYCTNIKSDITISNTLSNVSRTITP